MQEIIREEEHLYPACKACILEGRIQLDEIFVFIFLLKDQDDPRLFVGLQRIPERLTDGFLPFGRPFDLEGVGFCQQIDPAAFDGNFTLPSDQGLDLIGVFCFRAVVILCTEQEREKNGRQQDKCAILAHGINLARTFS